MNDNSNIPVCSIIDFYQHIPDYEDVMHLPSRELDERLETLRNIQKSYASEWRDGSFFIEDFRIDSGYPRSYDSFLNCHLPASKTAEYSDHTCGTSKYDRSKRGIYDEIDTNIMGTDSFLNLPKGSAVTTPSTLSNKSSMSKSVLSFGEEPVSKLAGQRKRGRRNGKKSTWSKQPYTLSLYPGGSPSFPDDFELDTYGANWTDYSSSEVGHKTNAEARSLPTSPLNPRVADGYSYQRRRSRLRSCQSTPDVRVTTEKNDHVFRAQPFPHHIFSNYLSKRHEEKINRRATSRKERAEELLRSSSLPPSMRRRQKERPISPVRSKPTRNENRTQERPNTNASPYRLRYLGVSPYRNKGDRSAASVRKTRKTSMEARDNLASLFRLQASRRKLEAESAIAAEAAQASATRRLRARATRLTPLWHYALSRPTTAEELMLKAARKRDEAVERNRRRRRTVVAMKERVKAAPTLMERQTLLASGHRPTSSLAGFHSCGSESRERTRRPSNATDWRCESSSLGHKYAPQKNTHGRPRFSLSSYLRAPKKGRSRVTKPVKNCHSDEELHKQSVYDTNAPRKKSLSRKKSLREVYYDENVKNGGMLSRPGSPYKPRSPVNGNPNYSGFPENYHSDEFTEEGNFPTDSYGEDSQTHLGPSGQNSPACSRDGQAYRSSEHKRTEQCTETTYLKRNPHKECVYGSSRHLDFYSRQPSACLIKSDSWPHSSPHRATERHRLAFSQDQPEGVDTVTKKFEGVSLASKDHRSSTTRELLNDKNSDPFSNPLYSPGYPHCSHVSMTSDEKSSSAMDKNTEEFESRQTLKYSRLHTPVNFNDRRFSPTRHATTASAERFGSSESCLNYAGTSPFSTSASEKRTSPSHVPLIESSSRQLGSQQFSSDHRGRPLSPDASNERRTSPSRVPLIESSSRQLSSHQFSSDHRGRPLSPDASNERRTSPSRVPLIESSSRQLRSQQFSSDHRGRPLSPVASNERRTSPPAVPLIESSSRQLGSQQHSLDHHRSLPSPMASNERRFSPTRVPVPRMERESGPPHSSQSSPHMQRTLYQNYSSTHDFIAGLDLASRGEFSPFHEDNMRPNVRSPPRHFLLQSRSASTYIS